MLNEIERKQKDRFINTFSICGWNVLQTAHHDDFNV